MRYASRKTEVGIRRRRLAWLAACALLAPFTVSAQTPVECQTLRKHGQLDQAKACFTRLAGSRDLYYQAEGYWGLLRYQEANDAFRAAVAAQPKNAFLRVRWGRMYEEHYQPGDAAQLFEEALGLQKDYPPALYGLALAASDGFEHKAIELAQKTLTLDPAMTEARELLAYLALEDNDPDKAAAEAKKAIAQDPEALDAMSILASIDLLNDQQQSPWFAKIFAVNPVYGQAYETAGHFFVINRRYEEGIAAYRKALELNPELWKARSELGVNLMRMGRHEDARRELETCFNAGYKSPSTVNSLRLLDSFKNFERVKTAHGVLMLNKKEAGVLEPYFSEELERCIETYTKKYHFTLPTPVTIEVYPDHEDFAVRTMGMPGLGALGVTFGNVVAMDSPSARPPGEFHWASTLWHEMSHVFVLQMTHSRVPRWFTEGLAVHEETQASPEWGDRLTPVMLLAVKDKKLLPVDELDRGFIHPETTRPDCGELFSSRQDLRLHPAALGLGHIVENDRLVRRAEDDVGSD